MLLDLKIIYFSQRWCKEIQTAIISDLQMGTIKAAQRYVNLRGVVWLVVRELESKPSTLLWELH